MTKIFLATSFSHQVDPTTGHILSEFRLLIEAILKGLRETGDFEVSASLEDKGWQITNDPPELEVQHDLEHINEAEVVVALLHDVPSVGLEFELGYAVAKDKKVIMVAQSDNELPYFNQGLVSSGLVTYITYDNIKYLIAQLDVACSTPKN